MYHTSLWTNTDWFAYEEMILHIETTLPVVFALVFGFIGLYLGSMHKPSVKTKE
jgi:NOL1/NOP2/fmu family ribosome biogenesis protein